MATTGFWPVKGSLKEVIEYANNPDKTTDPKFLDEDLAQAVQYAANDDKTDQKMYVSGINCTRNHAYEDMLAVQKRFGLRGTNVAYHGYQSFRPGEVTPEQAHEIGKETARKMWGDRYQVLVTTHLNTDSLHNHMVVNAVSFVDGKKFQNHIGDHLELRKISDRICLKNRLAVLEDAPFYNSEKKAYLIHKKGGKTHRDILKEDVKECIRLSYTIDDFIEHLYMRGYEYEYTRHSVRAPSWERGVRLGRIGFEKEDIYEMILANSPRSIQSYRQSSSYQLKDYQAYPLLKLERQLDFEIEHSKNSYLVMLDIVLYLLIELSKLLLGIAEPTDPSACRPQPLSPEARMACAKLDELTAQATLMAKYDIHTQPEVEKIISDKADQIKALEKERQQYWNKLKTERSPDRVEEIRAAAKGITERIKPLRKELKTAENILQRAESYRKALRVEHAMEEHYLDQERAHSNRNRDRGRER